MTNKERYYALDEIGIIGTQEKKSRRALAKMYKETGEFIRKHREAMKAQSSSATDKRRK